MATDFLTSYDYYSSRRDMEVISNIVESLKKILEEDKLQTQPLFLKTSENLILNIARKVVQEKKKTFLIGITGESASGKTVFVDNTIKACVKEKKEGIYTVIRCDDYYKDTSKELIAAGSYEELFKTGFSFDTPDAIDLNLMKEHLKELKQGKEIYSPLYNFITCESKKNSVLKKPAKLILNEGLYVLHEILRDIIDVKIYVYTPFEVIKDRWFARAASRGKTGLAAQMQFHDVNQTAFRHIRPTMDIADVVINGMTTQEYIEDFIHQLIEAITSVTSNKHLSL